MRVVECSKSIAGMMIDAGEAFDTSAENAYTILTESKEGEQDTLDSKMSRSDHLANMSHVARISDINDSFCEKPSIHLTQDVTVWSGKFPIEELKKGRSRELDQLRYM